MRKAIGILARINLKVDQGMNLKNVCICLYLNVGVGGNAANQR